MKKIWLICLLCVAFIASPFILQQSQNLSIKSTHKKPVKIAMSIWAGYAHAYIAQEKGFFKKNQVDVELILRPKVSDVLEMYKNGEVDGGLDVFTDAIVLKSQGYPVKVVYVTDYSNSGDVIIGRPQFHDLSDLNGKKISFSGFNTFSQVFVLKAMEQAKLQEYEVQFDIVPEMEVLEALEEGRIDAGHTWEPMTSQALKKGYRVLAKAGDIPGIITDVLFFNKDVIEQRPEDIKAIVQSLIEAHQYFLYNTGEGIALMSKAMGMTEEEMRQGLQGIKQLDLLDNFAALQPSPEVHSLYGSGDFIMGFMINTGQLNRILDFKEIIDSQFINQLINQKVKPSL